MTKKDYELIAKAIREAELSPIDRRRVAGSIGLALLEDNPRFNPARWTTACQPKQ